MKTLKTIAGHSTIGMTMNRYIHARKDKIMDAGKQMHQPARQLIFCRFFAERKSLETQAASGFNGH